MHFNLIYLDTFHEQIYHNSDKGFYFFDLNSMEIPRFSGIVAKTTFHKMVRFTLICMNCFDTSLPKAYKNNMDKNQNILIIARIKEFMDGQIGKC